MVVVCGRILAQFLVVCLCNAGKIMRKGVKYKKSLPEKYCTTLGSALMRGSRNFRQGGGGGGPGQSDKKKL